MCTVCASFAPVAGSTAQGLLALGAVAGGAAVGSLTGFIRRPAPELADQDDLDPTPADADADAAGPSSAG